METILFTGFEPFDGESRNPAWDAVSVLDGRVLQHEGVSVELRGLRLPTLFHDSMAVLKQGISEVSPSVVICVGQAGGRSQITPERVAINVDDAGIPDNQGRRPVDETIVPGGPAAYWSTLPVKQIVSALRGANIPSSVSNSAGTYVCNHVFYGLMHLLHTDYEDRIQGGFIHVPYIPEQVLQRNAPSMPLNTIVQGLEFAALTSI